MSLELNFSDERCVALLSDEQLLAAMARFEGALALALSRAGLVPARHAETIVRVCERATFDPIALARDARGAGALAIPFVKALTAQVAAVSQDAAGYLHIGATSQDVLDSAVVLCVRPAGERLLELCGRLGDACSRLAREHAATPMVARTLLQPAAPVPFGWKAAVWLSLVCDAYLAFRSAIEGMAVLQFGGPSGTLAALGDKGEAVSRALAQELDLAEAPIAWHGVRTSFARVGAESAILAGAAAKIARDVSLLMQFEVAEVAEPSGAGRGGSSSLPHKRNPALGMLAIEAGLRAPGLAATLFGQLAPEHERGIGQWQSQWLTLRSVLSAAGSGLVAMGEALEGLRVDPVAMRANLDQTRGLVYSEAVSVRLARALGKRRAHELTEVLCEAALREKRALEEVFATNREASDIVPPTERAALFDFSAQFGGATRAIERVLARWAARHGASQG